MNEECLALRRAVLLQEREEAVHGEHLATCEECRRFELEELELASLARGMSTSPPARHELRARIVGAIEHEKRSADRRRLRWFWAGVAMLLAAGTATGGWLIARRGAIEAERTVVALAGDHLRYFAATPAPEFSSGSTGEIAGWLRARTGLAVSVPVLPGAQPLGARRCNIRDRVAALVFYRIEASGGVPGGSGVSLFSFPTRAEDWSGMEPVPGSRSRRLCRAHDRGLGLLIWEERGLTYAIVSDLPDPELLKLAKAL